MAHEGGQHVDQLQNNGPAGRSMPPHRLQQDGAQEIQAGGAELVTRLELRHVVSAEDEHLQSTVQEADQQGHEWV